MHCVWISLVDKFELLLGNMLCAIEFIGGSKNYNIY